MYNILGIYKVSVIYTCKYILYMYICVRNIYILKYITTTAHPYKVICTYFQNWSLSPEMDNWLVHCSLEKTLNFIGIAQRNMGKGILIGAEMVQGQLHHQSSSQHGRQHRKGGNLELTGQLVGNPRGFRVSQTTQKVKAFSR